MYEYFMSSSKQQVYYITRSMSLCTFRALLVVQVWMGQKERQVHEVYLVRMVALGCQALQDFLLRLESIAFFAKGVSQCALWPLSTTPDIKAAVA